jgi:endonuclease-3
MRESRAAKRERALRITARLKAAWPESRCALSHQNALELLLSTILSAQCTDARVNQVTPELFSSYPNAEAVAGADLDELGEVIRSCGFYNQKAKSLKGCCMRLVEEHGGEVPQDREALVKLPGVGRKTANCVLGTWYGQPAMVVDTHMIRICNLLALTKSRDPEIIEQDMMKLLPPEEWVSFTHRIIDHGRAVCIARRPRCADCCLSSCCPSSQTGEGISC